MEAKLQELKTLLREANDLQAISGVLMWDQSTYMPEGGGPYRARHMALLERLSHERFTDKAVGRLLEELRPYEESLPYDSDDASLIRVARREYEIKTRVPSKFVAEMQEHVANAYQAWTTARPANDFTAVRPLLEKTLDLSRQYAEFFPHEHLADPLIAEMDYGMKAADVSRVFAELRQALVPIVQAITDQEPADDSCLHQHFPQEQQLQFGLNIAQQFGYDMERGRLDLTHHPFEIKLSSGDVRITTRVKPDDLSECLFSTLHEAGHALYEQGVDSAFDGTPLNQGTSAGVHESQSRLWENIVGRSRAFWEHYYPQLQSTFPEQLGGVPLDVFYRAVNKVQRSLIRTDADEVTYNLHVMIRFDLELDMLDDKLEVRHLPDAWNARYESDLGITPPDYKDGALQDVHWFTFTIGGGFQGYTLGNIMSLQFYEAALRAHPEIPAEVGRGQFNTLHSWLRENIYRHGSKFTANELLERVTGGPLSIEPYIKYLRAKFGELYDL
jgi:carboxypeptidase Taq